MENKIKKETFINIFAFELKSMVGLALSEKECLDFIKGVIKSYDENSEHIVNNK